MDDNVLTPNTDEELGEVVAREEQRTAALEGDLSPEERQAIESYARRLGWKPQAEFKGDPDKWRDAPEFVRYGESELPVLRENLRRSVASQERLEGTVHSLQARLNESGEVLKELQHNARSANENAYRRLKADIEARMAAAAASADIPAYNAAKAEFDALTPPSPPVAAPTRETAPVPTTPATPQVEPEVLAWIADNPWFEKDPVLNAFCLREHSRILRVKPDWTLTENLAEVKRLAIIKFPEEFGNPRRAGASAVQAPRTPIAPRASKANDKTYENLPPDAKAACDKYCRTIPNYTREMYLEQYVWDN